MWQFMQTTGREFGLEVNPSVDERYHVEKATRAACKYLKDAYQRYSNWLCVAAAYNGGQGRISSELRKQLVDQAVDLCACLGNPFRRMPFRMPCRALLEPCARSKNCVRFPLKLLALPFLTPCARSFHSLRRRWKNRCRNGVNSLHQLITQFLLWGTVRFGS